MSSKSYFDSTTTACSAFWPVSAVVRLTRMSWEACGLVYVRETTTPPAGTCTVYEVRAVPSASWLMPSSSCRRYAACPHPSR
jgi:hypothetical protein